MQRFALSEILAVREIGRLFLYLWLKGKIMICRYKLNANGKTLSFGNECLKNWNEVNYAIKRSDYGGVMRSFSSSFHFVGEAYDLILNAYLTDYLSANTTISVYTINEDQSYSLLYKARLDYGTMKITDNVVELNSFDDTIASLIKAKKSTKYEYKVDDLAENHLLTYDGLKIANRIDFVCGGTSTEVPGMTIVDYSVGSNGVTMPMYYTETDYMVKRSLTFQDVKRTSNAFDYAELSEDLSFVRCESDITVHLSLSFSMNVSVSFVAAGTHVARLVKFTETGSAIELKSFSNTFNETTTLGRSLYVGIDEDIALSAGDRLVVVLGVGINKMTDIEGGIVISGYSCSVTWVDRILPVSMSVIKPITLLNSLLSSINETASALSGVIVSRGDSRLDNAMILPSESARRITGAKLSTSFADFSKWMESVFGYVYVIEGNVVKFVHRDSLFGADVADLDDTVNNVEFTVNDGLIFSSVKAGYEKEEYDTANGADEFRWTTEYDTGVNIKDNTLELMSPYRADAYGIEFLAEGESSGRNTEIYFVNVLLSGDNYILNRSVQISGVVSPDTMFNAMYSPRSFVEANKSYLAVCTDSLKFASSEGNSEVKIDGVGETDLYVFDGRLFSVGLLSFSAVNGKEPDYTSLVRLSKNGRTYSGYVNERSCKYGRYEGTKYELLIKSIE